MIDKESVIDILVEKYNFRVVVNDTPLDIVYLKDSRDLKYVLYTDNSKIIISTNVLGEQLEDEISTPMQIDWFVRAVKSKLLEVLDKKGMRMNDVKHTYIQSKLVW